MKNRLTAAAIATSIVLLHGANARAQTHQDFRSPTFTRPSQSIRSFFERDRGPNHGWRSGEAPVIGPVFLGSDFLGPSYYDSVMQSYSASPFSGLDASRALFSSPFRGPSIQYVPAAQSRSFYESTIPYGNYNLRTGY